MDLELDLPDIGLDMGDLDLSGFQLDLDAAWLDFTTRYTKPPILKGIPDRLVMVDNAEKLAKDIGIQRGMRVHCIVSGDFIFGDFLEALMTTHGIKAKRLVINTLSCSQHNIDSLAALAKAGYIERLDLLVSVYFYGHNRKGLIPYIYKTLDIPEVDFQLGVSDCHCKTITIETPKGGAIVIHGSANLRSSKCMEQFCIEESRELLEFHNAVSDRILEVYSTINKPIRTAAKTWEAVCKSDTKKTEGKPPKASRKARKAEAK